MNYNANLIETCQKIVSESNKYNLRIHSLYDSVIDDVRNVTSNFPKRISMSQRIRAVAQDSLCICEQCGKVHGHPDRTFCTHKCYMNYKSENKDPNAHWKWKKKLAEERFQDSTEGRDFVTCQVCGFKGVDLTLHVTKVHDISREEYQTHYGKVYADVVSERFIGENNPAYNHGGKYSPFSQHFIHGYDENWHKEIIEKNRQHMLENPGQFQFEYYLDQANGDQQLAEKLYYEHQAKTLDYFISKYGEEEGKRRYKEKTERWMKSYKKTNFSEISQELFRQIHDFICDSDVYYATYDRSDKKDYINKEYILSVDGTYVRPDFIIVNKKKIIEFDGDYWHSEHVANPQREENRDNLIKQEGYEILHVKEYDYKNDPQGVIKTCLNFLNS